MYLDNIEDSRHEILKILKKEKSSVVELSSRLDISPTAIRQHLTILEGDSLIRKGTVRGGAGRPRNLYFLTDKADALFPKAYENFLEWMIKEIIEIQGEKKAREIIENIARKNAKSFKTQFEGKTLEEKIQRLVEISNEFGYYMEYEGENIIKVYNCIFSKSAKKFDPLICHYDIEFFGTMLGKGIKKKSSQARGSEYCSFEVICD